MTLKEIIDATYFEQTVSIVRYSNCTAGCLISCCQYEFNYKAEDGTEINPDSKVILLSTFKDIMGKLVLAISIEE